eukprot:3839985-Amphidinium_carterae.1
MRCCALEAAVAQLPERSELDAVTKRIDNLDSLVRIHVKLGPCIANIFSEVRRDVVRAAQSLESIMAWTGEERHGELAYKFGAGAVNALNFVVKTLL